MNKNRFLACSNQPTSLKFILILWLSVFVIFNTSAQTVQQLVIGPTTGTGTFSYGPIYRNTSNAGTLNYSRYAYIYTSTELNIPVCSKIISLEWLKKDTARVFANNTFNVWIANPRCSTCSRSGMSNDK